MNRVDELIAKFCPNGVKYKALDAVCDYVDYRGKTPKKTEKGIFLVTAKNIRKGYIDYEASKEYVALEDYDLVMRRGYAEIGDVLITTEAPCGNVALVDRKNIALAQRVIKYRCHECLDSRFLLHVLLATEFQSKLNKAATGGTVRGIKGSKLHKLTVPVPPLEVQREIVHILDSFTLLTAELTAELTARKKQYEFYRNKLLAFELEKCSKSKLSEIAQIYDGTHQTPEYTLKGIPFISVENINDIYSSSKYISKEAYNKYKIKPQVKDVFMTRIGSIGKCAIMTHHTDLAYYVSLALIRPNAEVLDSRYLKHYIESSFGTRELARRTLHNAVPIKINKDDIGKIVIKYPNIEIQRKIADILDNFDKICSDLRTGLPAEIEARQKQYEYYRDKLLSFKELPK